DRGESHPTEFEVLTAAAFQYFQAEKVDIAVLEVGMGGTYDSTNVIIPLVSVISGVDFDHTSFLGSSLKEIAANKAGIIKKGVPVVVGQMDEEARMVISGRARNADAQIFASSEIKINRTGNSNNVLQDQFISITGMGISMEMVRFALRGNYQLCNLATAITALQVIKQKGFRLDEPSIRNALRSLVMPGRLEIISHNPLVIADAAHNPQGAKALADSLNTLCPDRQRVLVLGLVDDKERDGILMQLGKNTRLAVVTRPQGPRGKAWQEVEVRWKHIFPNIPVVAIESIPSAIDRGLEKMCKDDYLLITGSFYVLDQARRIFVK
ncbi:MAG: cyanophycin synthetase, partial [Syntrophomonas sp.]|nr:cyanophycin synthetase [Syntrophomonas sp.]